MKRLHFIYHGTMLLLIYVTYKSDFSIQCFLLLNHNLVEMYNSVIIKSTSYGPKNVLLSVLHNYLSYDINVIIDYHLFLQLIYSSKQISNSVGEKIFAYANLASLKFHLNIKLMLAWLFMCRLKLISEKYLCRGEQKVKLEVKKFLFCVPL